MQKLKSSSTAENFELIGYIGKPHGLKGFFYIHGRNSLLASHATHVVVGKTPSCGRMTSIESTQILKNRDVLKLSGIESRTDLERLHGQALWVQIVEASSDSHPYESWKGQELYDSDGELVGVVADFLNHGSVDNLEVVNSGLGLQIPMVEDFMPLAKDLGTNGLRLKVVKEHFAGLWYQLEE